MATHFIDKEYGVDTSTAIADDTTGVAKVRNLPDAAGIVMDRVDGFFKYNDAGNIRTLVNTNEAQTLTTKTLTAPVITGATITTSTIGATLTAGAGVSAAETYKNSVTREGSLIITKIVVDLTGLVGSATDLDIIGNSGGTASANFGQLTVAVNGTLCGGKVTCLEVPAGGTADIDFYSATVGTGAQDVDVTTLTETVLITSGGAWASGTTKGMTTVPPANDFLYITNGAAAGGTFSAGKFEITLYGA